MKRVPLIAGNWKMFKTGSEAASTAEHLAKLSSDINGKEIMIAPSFTAISLVSNILKEKSSTIFVGAQNIFYEKQGAYTGEVSPNMLKDAGVSHVIIGHSERREYFHETDEDICKKIRAAIELDMIPIMCIGETESEKKEEKTFYVLDKQITNGLKGFRSNELAKLVIAYEPVWAIGTGQSATPEQAEEVHKYIRDKVRVLFDEAVSDNLRILYGGSVKPDNIVELMKYKNIDGVLVGGASLDHETFFKIINYDL